MSGPKVIRVVTREERIATCNTLLRQLDRAIDAWIRECKRIGKLTDQEIITVNNNREKLASLLSKDKFTEMQDRIPKEISYLTSDLEKRRSNAAQAAVNAKLFARQQKENAAMLLRELRNRSDNIKSDLITKLERIISGDIHGDEAKTLLSNAFSKITKKNDTGLTEAQRNLARNLIEEEAPDEYFDPTKEINLPINKRLQKVYQQLAELEINIGKNAAITFNERLNIIETAEPGNDTNLRIDSLVIDLANFNRRSIEDSNRIHEALEILAELQIASKSNNNTTTIITEFNTAISNKDFKQLTTLITTGREILDNFVKNNIAAARRTAILTGLSQLGYEVREGMSTAFAKQGRIIVEKPNLPGYGVEIGGSTDVSRLQVRAVALSNNRDLTRDRDIETLWCNDFGKLKEIFSSQGGVITIENSLAIGATPLKTVDSNTLNVNRQENLTNERTKNN